MSFKSGWNKGISAEDLSVRGGGMMMFINGPLIIVPPPRTDKSSAIISLFHPDLNDISFSPNTHQRQGTNNAENRWCTTSVFLT